ncbi:hypothetical protein KRR26_14475 [Corallococcus sp. M34]|uniref:hypothetical protein n=1 Tax=Citreicoccus inhibens TaxID=2849499 RepID=UPI001C21621A|nr:hypothetical protein [Citreicoccus inhibens]MBU8896821.1 hypothetical protein [Citreicoccus inhibens]
MRIRYRLLWAGVAVLGMAVLAVWLWPSPSAPLPPAPVMADAPMAAPRPPEPAPGPRPVAVPAAPRPVTGESTEARATVVPPRPGDVPPEPEVSNPPPQQNDPIEPEKPQTARWRLAKTERITAVLGRDVERLEREREMADSRGDSARREQLELLIQRQRVRLSELREEVATLTEAAKNEPPEE